MRAQFLGTAAAEGYPDPFCGCDNCGRARAAGGPSLRKRSALLIEDELLIDLGPDVLAASLQHGIPLDRLRYCLQTHEHSDHLHPALFLARSPFCGVHDAPRLGYYASRGALAAAFRDLGRFDPLAGSGVSEPLNLVARAVEPFETFEAGPYRVTALRAAHDPSIVALLYLIERDGRTLFYATDTGPLPEATWTALGAWGGQLDAVIMDHTFGTAGRSTGHLNGEQFREQIARLRALDLLADDARIYAHHIAHHSNPAHDELVRLAAAGGYLVPHDGLTIEI
jgi:phosphoribosyl 1,2-cyclic phosphate phosphodiesterase